MTEHPLPMFDEQLPAPEPDAPKKPRRKPMRKRGMAKRVAKIAAPKKRRKQRVVKPRKELTSSAALSVLFNICKQISDLLRPLTDYERKSVIESVKATL